MDVSLKQVAIFLKENNNFLILTHQYPDGDTLGSGFALCRALQSLGKKARVINNSAIPVKYSFLEKSAKEEFFEPYFVLSVDIADESLFGPNLKEYLGRVDICIDHHRMNKDFATYKYVDCSAAATALIVYDLLKIMEVKIDTLIADCIYTGLATDTGCFKYQNTTSKTHIVAAKMLELGADFARINKIMFDQKTKEQFIAERYIFDSLEFYLKDKLAIIYVTLEVLEKSGADDSLIDGIAGIPKQIEGVLVGATFRQKEEETFKISVRTEAGIDASLLCKRFGGGGHVNAAGCTLKGNLSDVKKAFIDYVESFIKDSCKAG